MAAWSMAERCRARVRIQGRRPPPPTYERAVPRLCPPLPFHGSLAPAARPRDRVEGVAPWPIEPNEFLLGRLVLPTGQLVACDPLCHLGQARPFERSVRPGTYAVRLGALGGDAAYVGVLVGEGEVVRWEAALMRGQPQLAHPYSLQEAPRLGVGFDVSATTAAFLDVAALHALSTSRAPNLPRRLVQAGYLERPHAVVDLEGAGNLVAFGTGSVGRFASYWGLDASGTPVVLITDLGVLHKPRARAGNVIPFRRPR